MLFSDLCEAILTDELKNKYDLLSELYPIIEECASNGSRCNRLITKISDYIDSNSSILMTSTVGQKLYFNSAMDDIIFNTLGIDKDLVVNAIGHNVVFNAIKENLKRESHLIFSIPALLLIRYFILNNKEQEAKYLYCFLYYKPYSSSVNNTFKYLNLDQMSYTIENLNNRFSIKKLGTVQACIEDISSISYANYREDIITATDKGLYDVYVSGVQTRIKGFISNIFGEYLKNTGKYKPYETENRGSDEDSSYFIVNNVSFEIGNIADKVANRIISNPIDYGILEKINSYKANPKFGIPGISINKIENILQGIIEKRYSELHKLFRAMLGAFVMDSSYKAQDIKTPVFLKFALDNVYSVNNVKKENVLAAKTILREMIEAVSAYFIGLGKTQQSYIQKAVYIYFTFMLMQH